MKKVELLNDEVRRKIIKRAYKDFFNREVDVSGYKNFYKFLNNFAKVKDLIILMMKSHEGQINDIYVSNISKFIGYIIENKLYSTERDVKILCEIANLFYIGERNMNLRIDIDSITVSEYRSQENGIDIVSWHVEEHGFCNIYMIISGGVGGVLKSKSISKLISWNFQSFYFKIPVESIESNTSLEIDIIFKDINVCNYTYNSKLNNKGMLSYNKNRIKFKKRALSDKDKIFIKSSNIFHEDWYKKLYLDVDFSSIEPIDHFISKGIFEERSPHPLFIPNYFRTMNPNISSEIPTFISYIKNMEKKLDKTSPLIDSKVYLDNYSSHVEKNPTKTILEDFCKSENRSKSFSFFDFDYFVEKWKCKIPQSPNRLLEHFLVFGLMQNNNPTPLIDLKFMKMKGSLEERHENFYELFDSKVEQQATHPLVDILFIKNKHPHIKINPSIFYLKKRNSEEKIFMNPLFDEKFYVRRYKYEMIHVDPFIDFIEYNKNHNPNYYFDTEFYKNNYLDENTSYIHPIQHYCEHGISPYLEVGKNFGQRFYLTRHSEIYPDDEGKSFKKVPPLIDFMHGGLLEKRIPLPPKPFLDIPLSRSRENIDIANDIKEICNSKLNDKPIVSIIIPSYNNITETLRCILSVLKSKDTTPFKILIIDDASPNGAGDFLTKELLGIKNIKVHVNKKNIGFLKSCNFAVSYTEEPYFYLLNNDTIVTDGWLDELVSVFEREKNVGIAGAKLVYPNGLLQEAGGILWRDAVAANFGRMDDPFAPEFNYQRDVDYISGAAILVSRAAWDTVDGFTDDLAPAYYEDSELAMKMRAHGFRVIYQPLSEVIHDEGMSSGTDLNSGVKQFQEINRKKVANLWREKLNTMGNPGNYSRDIVDRASIGRILFYEAEAPHPDIDSGSVTTFNYLKILSSLGYRVTFVSQNLMWEGEYSKNMQRIGIEVIYNPYVKDPKKFILSNAQLYDIIFMARAPIIGSLMHELKEAFPEIPVVFDTVDIHHLRMERQAALEDDIEIRKQAQEMKELELSLLKISDVSMLVSTYEEKYVRNQIGSFPHVIIPLIYESAKLTSSYSERKDFAFVGGFRHLPNIDAVKYLVNEIWPKYRSFDNDAKLHIIGSHMPREFEDFTDDNIIVVGFVPNLEEYLLKIRVSLCPLRYGAGVKGKVGNSLRLGLPVVGTQTAIEGMGLVDDETVIIGESSEHFAQQMQRLYDDPNLWTKISVKGHEHAETNYSIDAARETLSIMCRSIIYK